MKRILLLSLVCCIGLLGYSQNMPQVDKALLNKAVKIEKQAFIDGNENFALPINNTTVNKALAVDEYQVGISYYDLWSNTTYANRLYRWPTGEMGAVWIYGEEPTAFPDRGTGFNYYDGTQWGPQPTERLENTRCGWPNIAPWGDGIVTCAHNGATGLEFMWAPDKSNQSWTQQNFLGPAGIENDLTWPRVITSGSNNEYVHLIVNSYVAYEGQATAILYSRSSDGGATWDPENIIPDGTGDSYYFEIGADEYTWASYGDNVALLVGGAWVDLFMLKSEDNGDSWDKTVIWEHPYPFFDFETTIADTFYCVDNSAFPTMDNAGKVHVVFGINRVAHWDVGTTYSYYPYVDGIGYWNEDMPTFSNNHNALAPPQYGYVDTEMVEDVNYIGWMQDVDGSGTIDLSPDMMSYRSLGPSTMPTITVDDQGRRFVLFASTTETYVNDVYNYKHIWARAYDNGSWGEFMDLSDNIVHIFDECIYPQLAPTSDDNIYYLYMADVTPGLALDEDHGYQENRFIIGTLPKTDLLTGVQEVNAINEDNVSQNRPNPFSNTSIVEVTLEQSADLSLMVTNLMGQTVYNVNLGNMPVGTHPITIDATNFESGVYFYTVRSGKSTVTKRMIVQ